MLSAQKLNRRLNSPYCRVDLNPLYIAPKEDYYVKLEGIESFDIWRTTPNPEFMRFTIFTQGFPRIGYFGYDNSQMKQTLEYILSNNISTEGDEYIQKLYNQLLEYDDKKPLVEVCLTDENSVVDFNSGIFIIDFTHIKPQIEKIVEYFENSSSL